MNVVRSFFIDILNIKKIIIYFVLVAFFVMVFFMFFPRFFINYEPLAIVITQMAEPGRENPGGFGAVLIFDISVNGQPLPLSDIELNQGWWYRYEFGEALIADGFNPSSFELVLPPGEADVSIVFYRGAEVGMVRLETPFEAYELDLFAAYEGAERLQHVIRVASMGHLNLISFLLAFLIGWAAALLFVMIAYMPRRQTVLILLLVILAGSSVLFNASPVPSLFDEDIVVFALENRNPIGLTLGFSETEHFHTEGILVEIIASIPGARIYYTICGTVPTVYSNRYTGPIYFALEPELYSVVLRAIAVYGEIVTLPLTHTFFIGENVHERFGTLVFSLSTNPEYLFDHYIGCCLPFNKIKDSVFVRMHSNLAGAHFVTSIASDKTIAAGILE